MGFRHQGVVGQRVMALNYEKVDLHQMLERNSLP